MADATKPPGRTVRARIAVAVDHNGRWSACGGSILSGDEETRAAVFVDDLADGEVFHWVEADIPVPEKIASGVIQGDVVEE